MLAAVRAVSQYCAQEGDAFHISPTNNVGFLRVRDLVPWKEIMGKLVALDSDARTALERTRSDLSEVYRAPFLNLNPWKRLRKEFIEEVVYKIHGPLRELELKGVDDIGPPLDTSWSLYYKDRFRPHYLPYTGQYEVEAIASYMHEFADKIKATQGGRKLAPLSVQDTLARRRVESDMGFYHMRSLKSLEAWERYKLLWDVKNVIDLWDYDPSSRKYAIVPGTRISHTALGSEAEDYNRVIMSVDIFAYVDIGRWAYPVLEAFQQIPETQHIFGYKGLEKFVQENDEYGYISLDTSRMDQSIKYDPLGRIYADAMCETVDMPAEQIQSIVYQAHHPMIVTPGGIYFGAIGNASGKTDTTNENTLYSLCLAHTFCDSVGIKREDRVIGAVGDDTFIAYKRKKYHLVDGTKLVTSHWAKYGFKAKEEKQEFSPDTVLFLKRRFSREPEVGESTMLLTNVFKKLVYMQPSQFASLYSSKFNDEFDYVSMLRYLRILNAEDKYKRRMDRIEKEGQGSVGPVPPNALWPYYIPQDYAFRDFHGWEGVDGPVTFEHNRAAREFRERLSVIPDARATYMIGVFQALSQCVTHPQFLEFIRFLAERANLPHNVDWIGFLTTLGESMLPSYHQEGGVGPILYAASMFLQARYGDVSTDLTNRVEVWLEEAPLSLRARYFVLYEKGMGSLYGRVRPAQDSGSDFILEALNEVANDEFSEGGPNGP